MTSRRSQIQPFRVMEMMAKAQRREAAGLDVLHLEVGQPASPAPAGARTAASRALETDVLGYTAALGLEPLRERIALWYHQRHGLNVSPAQVVVTTGASGSCVLAFLALWDHGDRVGVLEPGYPCYRNDLEAFGIEAVGIPVGPESGYAPTVAHLDAAGPLDGLVLASPSNPTGTVLSAAQLDTVARWAADREVAVVVDEIYHGITYDAPAPTMLAHDRSAVVFNSFSKYFSMTGWRLGWIVAPEALVTPLERLAQNLTIAAPTISQVAGLAAFECTDELDAHVSRYAVNRSLLVDGLTRAGLDRFAPPDGAFYLWVDVGHLGIDSSVLCTRWLDELGVATTPGIDFDPHRGHRFVRCSYAGSTDQIVEAVQRLHGWLG